jgi:hypothetical protein
MIRHSRLLLATVLLQTALISTAFAETDKKIVGGSACQAQEPKDRDHLRYAARGIEALDRDVEITCPIVRDSTKSAINFVDARYQRGFDMPPQGSDDNQFMGVFKGELWSCSNGAAGFSECQRAKGDSGEDIHPNTNRAFSVNIDAKHLPHDENRYFVYKTTLPKFAVLKSITYQEQVQ